MKHLEEHQIQGNRNDQDVLMYYTTTGTSLARFMFHPKFWIWFILPYWNPTRIMWNIILGWMMWNWMVSALALGTTLVLYDGSPLHPHPAAMWDLVDACGITVFGTSAKWIAVQEDRGLKPRISHNLKTLKVRTFIHHPQKISYKISLSLCTKQFLTSYICFSGNFKHRISSQA